IKLTAEDDHPFARGLAAIADSIDLGRPALSLIGDAQIPPGAGLGASAAFAVAISRALLAYAKKPLDIAAVTAAAGASEAVLHGQASGVDVAVAVAGGVGVFRRSTGLRPIALRALRVLVGPSGSPRSTSAMIERVAQATRGAPDDARLAELGGLTDTGTVSLLAGDLAALGKAMDRAHDILGGLGVSTPLLDGLCKVARDLGAHGAKLTGAGGGGAVIAIAPRDKEAGILAGVRSGNRFATGSGLASSASGFAALAVAAARAAELELSPRELSLLARRGSGSAARSIFGGFVRMHASDRDDDAYAEPISSSLEDQ